MLKSLIRYNHASTQPDYFKILQFSSPSHFFQSAAIGDEKNWKSSIDCNNQQNTFSKSSIQQGMSELLVPVYHIPVVICIFLLCFLIFHNKRTPVRCEMESI